MVWSYLVEAWPPPLILHPVLLSQMYLSMSYPDYPHLAPSLLSQPESFFRASIHFLSLFIPILQSRLLACLMPCSRSELLTSSLTLWLPNPDSPHWYLSVPVPPFCIVLIYYWLTSPPITSYPRACRLSPLGLSVTCLLSSLIKYPASPAWLIVHDPNAKLVTVYYLLSIFLLADHSLHYKLCLCASLLFYLTIWYILYLV